MVWQKRHLPVVLSGFFASLATSPATYCGIRQKYCRWGMASKGVGPKTQELLLVIYTNQKDLDRRLTSYLPYVRL